MRPVLVGDAVMGSQRTDTSEQVILVTPKDEPVGVADKTAAHERGLLHRAFSVFVLNPDGEWLLQRRATHKYHSGGLWSNTCCSHPRPGETVEDAAHRRLREEMGFDCALDFAFSFVYRTELDNGMVEHELDHVFLGVHAEDPAPDPAEVEAWRRLRPDLIRTELSGAPDTFTYWFRLAFDKLSRNGRKGAGEALLP